MYESMHVEIMKRKREWFHHFKGFYYALWWIEAGKYPSAEEAAAKLKHLQTHGLKKHLRLKQLVLHLN